MVPASLRDALLDALGPDGVVTAPAALRTYEMDGLTGYREAPGIVVLPKTTAEVSTAVRLAAEHGVPVVPRGAGTGLSGGALPNADGVLVGLSRMRRIVSIDVQNQRAIVEPGVSNLAISEAARPHGLYYAPDPSSQQVCSIGGNVAENAGGAHCLKYGFTTHHVQALEVVLGDGTVVDLGSPILDAPGYDLRGVFIGSEGTLGICTRVDVRLLRIPEGWRTLVADFDSPAAAGDAVTAIVEAGIVPAAVEMLDTLAIEACEVATGAGYTRGCGAALVVEVDGPDDGLDDELHAIEDICTRLGSTKLRVAQTARERGLIWQGRKAAFAAMGRISPNYFVQDGVIPRTRLGAVLARIAELSAENGLRVANVFHAGDGNLHPLVLYDGTVPGEEERADRLATRIAELCVEEGGSISGEHGIGVDKACSMPKMFSEDDLAVMHRVRRAFDPAGRMNPGKLFPTPRLCGERPGPHRPHPLEAAGVIERY